MRALTETAIPFAAAHVTPPVQIPLNRPFNWGRLLITLAVVALAIYRAPVLYRYLEPVLKRPFVWGVVAVVRHRARRGAGWRGARVDEARC